MKVEFIDRMGSDLSVVNAARVSFDSASKQLTDRDNKLINYLTKFLAGTLTINLA